VVLLTQKEYRKTKNSRIILRLLMIVLLIITIGASMYYIIFHSTIFIVKSIQIEGIDKIEESVILDLSEINYNDQLFGFRLSDIESAIEKHPYVRTANIKRKNRNTINIVVREREEYAIIPYMGSYVTLDDNKFVLKVSDGILESNICIITGIEFTSFTIGNQAQAENIESLDTAYQVLSAAREADILDMISEVNIDQNEQIKIVTFNGVDALLGYIENPAYSILALKEALITLHTRDMRDVIIDMRYEGHITVRQRSRQEVENE